MYYVLGEWDLPHDLSRSFPDMVTVSVIKIAVSEPM